MIILLINLLRLLPFLFGGHRQLALENLALRQQLAVYKRTVNRPRLQRSDRLLWVWLSRVWPAWRRALVSIDFFTVPTARLRVLFVFVVVAHDRRRVLHFNVTEHPTAAWTAQQIVDAFPDDSAPSCLLRDRDSVYGHVFRRECLNHVLVLGERHLRRTLARYFAYYHRARTHLSLDKDAPHGRPIERPELGRVIPIRELRRIQHRYVRQAAWSSRFGL